MGRRRSTGIDRHVTVAGARVNASQEAFVGNQAGGRVFLFLSTDHFKRDYGNMLASGINFVRGPAEAAYGTVAVFEDLYGNLWDLVEFSGGRSDLPSVEA